MPRSPQNPTIFEFQDYKAYLKVWISSRPNGGRGEKSNIAKRARCHLAYISQILTGKAHFNLEQADALNGLFEHGEDEAHFFILLVEHARAGTPSLQKYFARRIRGVLDQRLHLKNRFTDKKSLDPQNQSVYYSHWAYCAVHMAILNPSLRTPGSIARYFNVDVSKVVEILDFLVSVGLVRNDRGGFLPGDVRIHLAHDSPLISKHHANWRLQAMRSFERETPHELHYSGVVSVSRADLSRVREIMVGALEKIRAVVKESKDETVYCYALDLFGLGSDP